MSVLTPLKFRFGKAQNTAPLAVILLIAAAPAWGAVSMAGLGAAANHDGEFCLWTDAAPGPAAAVTLIIPDKPQTIAHAAVTGPGTACPAPITPKMPAYALRLTDGEAPPNEALIAVIGAPQVSLRDGAALWNAAKDAVTFRACASSDGVHLTAWQTTKRVWHAYYYVGQDLESDCKAEESAP